MASWNGDLLQSTQVTEWIDSLASKDREEVAYLLNLLSACGPALGRPKAGLIKGRPLDGATLLELRGQNPFIRILYVFDRNRNAVLLYGGDKSDDSKWKRWYPDAIKNAARIYETYQANIRDRKEYQR